MGQILFKQPDGPNFIPNPKDPPIVGNKVAVKPFPQTGKFHKVFEGKPDEDVLDKMYYMTKTTFPFAGIVVAANHAVGEPGMLNLWRHVCKYGVPFIGGGIIFVAAQACAGSFRKKNDQYNTLIASYASAGLIAAKTRKSKNMAFFVSGFFIFILGAAYKDFALEGKKIIPEMSEDDPLITRRYHWQSHRTDFRVYENKPGYWIAAPSEGVAASSAPIGNQC